MVPVRIPGEDFMRLRVDIARWHADRSLDANWNSYPESPIVYMYFEDEDITYEFMTHFEGA